MAMIIRDPRWALFATTNDEYSNLIVQKAIFELAADGNVKTIRLYGGGKAGPTVVLSPPRNFTPGRVSTQQALRGI